MPPQITCASALPGKRRNTKIAFSPQMLYYCIARIQPVAASFCQNLSSFALNKFIYFFIHLYMNRIRST